MTHKPYAPTRLVDGGGDTPDELAVGALLANLPDPAPHDIAVERVWRRIAAPPVPQPSWQRRMWIPATLAALAVLFVFMRKPSGAGELLLSSGSVYAAKPAERWKASKAGEPLVEAERVRTDAAGSAVVSIPGIAAVLLGPESDVALERMHSGAVLRLSRGVVTARVSKRAPGEPFVIETDRYSVKVVGTLFTVEQGQGGHTVVSVREGTVDVSDGMGRVDRVLAGQRWVSESVNERSPDRTMDSVKTLLDGVLEGRPAAEVSGPFATAVAPVAAPTKPPSGSAAGGASSPGPLALAPSPAADVHGTSAPRASRAAPATGSETTTGAPWREVEDHTSVVDPGVAPIPSSHPETAVVPPPTVTPPPGADASVDDGPYARARALEAKREFGAAAREYERASVEDPAHADLATYRLGRLAQKNLHDPVRARAAFTRYRERFPNGALLPEVDFAMLELEVETHSDTAALADASRFLAAHPTSERADEVRLLRGNLRRDQSQCSEAIGDYAMVSSAPFTDHAVYSTAYCQRKLGDRQGAAATLRGYLARFPNGAHRAEAEKALSDD